MAPRLKAKPETKQLPFDRIEFQPSKREVRFCLAGKEMFKLHVPFDMRSGEVLSITGLNGTIDATLV